MKFILIYSVTSFLLFVKFPAQAQKKADTLLPDATLTACINYALVHQPLILLSLLNERISDEQVKIKLADWYPQLNVNYNLQHNFELPTSYFSGGYQKNGTYNTSFLGLNAIQTIFNKDLLLANKTIKYIKNEFAQNTASSKIEIAVAVGKAFYDVMLTNKQVDVLGEAIKRLAGSLKDTYSQYQSGITDKTDYKRATIALNNAMSLQKQARALIPARKAYLKQLMGYPDSLDIVLYYDTLRLESDAIIDTLMAVNYSNRIEYMILQTKQHLLQANLEYFKKSYLPTISAFGNYNLGFLSNNFIKTYNQFFPNSNLGLQLTMPIFQGHKRMHQVEETILQLNAINLDITFFKSRVNTEYSAALAVYKSNLYNYGALKENLQLAQEVYNVIQLQYSAGIKTYLEVILAESELRTTQLNYYNSLYLLVQSKLDVQKALGTIQY